jgi:hypothetical protein
MNKHASRLLGAALSCAALGLTVAPATAQPGLTLTHLNGLAAQDARLTEKAQYRGGYYRGSRGYRSGRYGRNAAIGIGGLIVGGILLSEAARSEHRRDHASDWQRCDQQYRSFERDTSMYTGYDGRRRVCPYLN